MAPFINSTDAFFVVCSQTFALFWLRKTAVPVKIFWYSFRVFLCACPTVISSNSGKSFHFPFPYFVIHKMSWSKLKMDEALPKNIVLSKNTFWWSFLIVSALYLIWLDCNIQRLIEISDIVVYYYKISREKFEPESGFEPRTSGFPARRSTTWAILVLMPAHVQISLLRRMPILPG